MSDIKQKSKIKAQGGIQLTAETASRVLQLDGSGNINSSSVTNTELGYLSGATSSIQTQLGDKQSTSEKGAANGYASLDSGGKVPVAQLPNSIMAYQGTYDASSNTPTLVNGTGNIGDVYRVSVAGAGVNSLNFIVGDYAIYNGSVWEKAHSGADAVVSVNGASGVVVLSSSDISEGSNLYFTDERAQDAVGNILTDSSKIDFTYNDGANTITATIVAGSLVNADINASAAIDASKIADGSVSNAEFQYLDGVTSSIQTQLGNKQPLDATLTALAAHNTNGILVQTAADTFTGRSISAGSAIAVSNGDGVAGNPSIALDIDGLTAITTPNNADELVVFGSVASANRKITRANFLSGIALNSAGDINETSFSMANNQAAAADVTGLAFANASVRSFKSLVSIAIDATADLFEVYELLGVQKGSGWDMSQSSTGDDSQVVFSITSAGQIQYTSANLAGFVSGAIKFRASTTSI
jgi:hypothetical protein